MTEHNIENEIVPDGVGLYIRQQLGFDQDEEKVVLSPKEQDILALVMKIASEDIKTNDRELYEQIMTSELPQAAVVKNLLGCNAE